MLTFDGFKSPVVQAEAMVAGAAVLLIVTFLVAMANTCERAKSDCDQVLAVAHRIPGL